VGIGLKAIGAGPTVGLAGIGAGNAEMDIGAVATGAIVENKEFFGTGILLTMLPESIVVFGLMIGLLILFV
jgi:V/A-type H+-transporting ATPase subunit K